MPQKEKQKKKNWKERQRERQIKQQRTQEAYETQKQRGAARKPRKWPRGKVLGALFLIVLVFGAYGIWQLTQPSTEPPVSNPTAPPAINPTNPLEAPYEFTMSDISGNQFSLNSFRGRVVVIHIMAVGCSGQIERINENQLTQLKTVCNSFCGYDPVTLITVAVATCASSNLELIRTNYGITWLFGNDYDDGAMDVAQKYASHGDGTIVLVDKTFHISDSYATVSASTLSLKINQLLRA